MKIIEYIKKSINDVMNYIRKLLSRSIKSFNIEIKDHDLVINVINAKSINVLNDSIKIKEAFYWSTSSFSESETKKENFGIIESLDSFAHKVIFDDKDIHLDKNMFHIVDVKMIKLNGFIKMYKIIKVHESLNFEDL